MKTKLVIVLLVLALALCLASCDDTQKTTTTTTPIGDGFDADILTVLLNNAQKEFEFCEDFNADTLEV